MAELDIGQHCSEASCKQLDFLPITCTGCDRVFCKEHSLTDSHGCSGTGIRRPDVAPSQSQEAPVCAVDGCNSRQPVCVICSHCNQSFCLQHRHGPDHGCHQPAARQPNMAKTAQHVQEIVSRSGQHKPGHRQLSKKAKALAAKVGLMKLKQKAVGSRGLPELERVYLNVFLPVGSRVAVKAMFFSTVWSIGRIIDIIAAEADLKNENHVTGSRRLRLFDKCEGHILETDRALDFYVSSETIYSGGDVILEYVSQDTSYLENHGDYKL